MKQYIKNAAITFATLAATTLFAQTLTQTDQNSQGEKATLENAESITITQSGQSDQEAGKYSRKSISYINSFWALDRSGKEISENQAEQALSEIHTAVAIKRFDYNEVSPRVMQEFGQQVGQLKSKSLTDLIPALERSFAPEIMKVLNAQKEMRAAALTTEQQRNSFMSDKAKEIGYTLTEIEAVMNSAYIYLPLAGGYSTVETENTYIVKMQLGVAWYKIDVIGDSVSVRYITQVVTSAMGLANKQMLGVQKPASVYRNEAFESMIATAAKNIETENRKIPVFSLSGQTLRRDGSTIGIDIGASEGVALDDKYLIYQQFQDEKGVITEKESGWVRITSVADSASKDTTVATIEYVSNASIVSGDPLQGDVVREYARLPIDILFGWRMSQGAVSFVETEEALINTNGALFVEADFNVGRLTGVSQLFFGLGIGLSFPSDDGFREEVVLGDEITSPIGIQYEASLTKKIAYRRFALALQGGASIAGVSFQFDNEDYSAYTVGAFGTAGLDIAITPSLTLSARYRYDVAVPAEFNKSVQSADTGLDETLEFNPTGGGVSAGLIWSLPSISFNFVDIIKLGLGI